jgi:hypothetical protein
MATTFLTPEERREYDAVPNEISRRETVQHFTLTPDDLAEVNRCRRSALRFGFALQACYLRWLGRFPEDVRATSPPRPSTTCVNNSTFRPKRCQGIPNRNAPVGHIGSAFASTWDTGNSATCAKKSLPGCCPWRSNTTLPMDCWTDSSNTCAKRRSFALASPPWSVWSLRYVSRPKTRFRMLSERSSARPNGRLSIHCWRFLPARRSVDCSGSRLPHPTPRPRTCSSG